MTEPKYQNLLFGSTGKFTGKFNRSKIGIFLQFQLDFVDFGDVVDYTD
jgi:hypothetical protein